MQQQLPTHLPSHKPHTLGLVLAGGRSSRFGTADKGMYVWRQRPLIEHVLQSLSGQVDNVTVSCNQSFSLYEQCVGKFSNPAGQFAPLCLRDDSALPAFSGPLSGIFTLLNWLDKNRQAQIAGRTSAPTYLMVCCCDNPLLPQDIVGTLKNTMLKHSAAAVYPIVDGNHARLTLLLQIDRAAVAMREILSQPASRRGMSVRHWLSMLSTQTIELSNSSAACNINLPTDLDGLNPPANA